MRSGFSRRGSLLIVVAGMIAIMVALSLGFIMRMRSDAEDAAELGREVQARAMLSAGLMYIQEASRLGWDRWGGPGADPSGHDESYGWIDVRDGRAGPLDRYGMALSNATNDFPAIGGKAARFTMDVLARPPWAVRLTAAYNPIPTTNPPALSWGQLVSYKTPDPQPLASTWTDFQKGDWTPVQQSVNRAWFRVMRIGKTTFRLACGAGATRGWRTYQDAVQGGEGATFQFSQSYFDELRAQETILFYECEWSPTVGFAGGLVQVSGEYALLPTGDPADFRPRQNSRQFLGSILWLKKLPDEPADW